MYSWSEQRLLQRIDLGMEGVMPLEIRFLHDPLSTQGFVGCALYANVFRLDPAPAKRSRKIWVDLSGFFTFSMVFLSVLFHFLSCRFYRKEDGTWAAHKVISIPPKKVEGWAMPEMPGKTYSGCISLSFAN